MLINFDHIKTFYNALIQKMKSFRGNWNQNDPTADDYIKNRTHWSEGVKETIIIDWDVDFDNGTIAYDSDAPIVYQAFIEDASLTSFKIGQKYTVIWDDKTYECVAKNVDGIGVIGNLIYLGYMAIPSYEDTGEPFVIGIEEGYGGMVGGTEAGKHTCVIKIVTEVVHKLDKKYIDMPDGIVTEDSLPDILNDNLAPVAFTNDYDSLSGKPTVYEDVVRYGANQSLTASQKSVARTNINAANGDDVRTLTNNLSTITNAIIRHDIAQSLTAAQKKQAIANMDIYSKDEVYSKDESYSKEEVYSEAVAEQTVIWDGDITGRDKITFLTYTYYKVSDLLFNANDVISAKDWDLVDANLRDDDYTGESIRILGNVVIADASGDLYFDYGGIEAGITVPSAGIYFLYYASDHYTKSVTIEYKAKAIPSDVIGVVKTINNEAPDSNGNYNVNIPQSDWSEQNESSLSYIKNRTHYIGFESISVQETIAPNTTTTITIDNVRCFLDKENFNVKIGIQGGSANTSYITNKDTSTWLCTLNNINVSGILNSTSEDNVYSLVLTCVSSDSEEHVMDVFCESATYIPLDEKYIPSSIARVSDIVQPDFSQSDSEAPDYVKGRTHYEETTVVNEPLNITWDGNTEGLLRVNSIYYKISDLVLTDEQIKSITYTDSSGTTIVVANSWNMMVNMGTAHEGGASLGTYCYVVKKDGAVIEGKTFNEAGIYFVSFGGVYVTSLTTTEPVEQTKTVVHKLDKKFLPDDVGGGGLFVVTVTRYEGSMYEADCDFAEAIAAAQSGKLVQLKTPENKRDVYINLSEYNTDSLRWIVTLMDGNTFTHEMWRWGWDEGRMVTLTKTEAILQLAGGAS